MRTFLILLILIIVLSIIACARLSDLQRRNEPVPACECTCNETWEFDTPILDEYEEWEE